MSLILNSEAGSASANSFCSLASANEYLQLNIHTYSDWSSLSTANAESCLILATKLLDKQIDWIGTKATEEQALRWPREYVTDPDGYDVDEDTIPKFLIEATAEYARFLSLKDRTAENDTLGFSRLEAGGLAAYIDKRDRAEVMPSIVFQLIKNYGRKTSGLMRTLERA